MAKSITFIPISPIVYIVVEFLLVKSIHLKTILQKGDMKIIDNLIHASISINHKKMNMSQKFFSL